MNQSTISQTCKTDVRVAAFLNSHQQVRPRNLQVRTRFGKLTIDGEVETWFAKQVAQESIRRLEGVNLIDNRLKVAR